MFIPSAYRVEEWNEIVAMVREIRAADLISVDSNGSPISTLMPCIWDAPLTEPAERDEATSPADYGVLYVHMARANKHWREIKPGARGLAIFNGPQGYISASNYREKEESGRVVSTWNYTSVHLHGTLDVIDDPEYVKRVVMDLSRFHEASRANPWNPEDIPADYLASELAGIVAVKMTIDRVEAKAKMSQNHSDENRQRIIDDLRSSSRSEDQLVADIVEQKLRTKAQ